MKKLLMMIVLACTVQAAAVLAQEPEVNTMPPNFVETKEQKEAFAEFFESERATVRYKPRLVCTKADAPRPGARGVGGPCNENFRMKIPINNSPAWDCEQAHGVGNCLLIEFPNPSILTIRPDGMEDQTLDPYYVPKCKQDFRFYFVFTGKVGITSQLREYWLYCGRLKESDK